MLVARIWHGAEIAHAVLDTFETVTRPNLALPYKPRRQPFVLPPAEAQLLSPQPLGTIVDRVPTGFATDADGTESAAREFLRPGG